MANINHFKSLWPLLMTAKSSESFHLKAKKQQIPFKEILAQDEKNVKTVNT